MSNKRKKQKVNNTLPTKSSNKKDVVPPNTDDSKVRKEEEDFMVQDNDDNDDNGDDVNSEEEEQDIESDEEGDEQLSQSEEEEEEEKEEEEEGASVSTEEESASAFQDESTSNTNSNTNSTTTKLPSSTTNITSDGRYHNKQRTLILTSRGVTSRHRHLLQDLQTLIPHHKKDSKLDATKTDVGGVGAAVNEIADMRGCTSILFLECRKKMDAYLWIGHTHHQSTSTTTSGTTTTTTTNTTSGPSAKFLVENIHTMDELKLTGNCMKGSRPILSFDANFDSRNELQILKCLFIDVFGTPRGHPKSKPFVDRVMGFYYADGKIWIRNYQIVEEPASNAKEAHHDKKVYGKSCATSLVEIGPRLVLNPIRIFRGSFGGQTLYQNEKFMSPNQKRADLMRDKGKSYESRKLAQKKRKERKEDIVVPQNPLDDVFR